MRQLIAVCVMSLALPAWAEGPSPVKVAELSAKTFAKGLETSDPLLILAAARMRKTLAPIATERAALDGLAGEGAPLEWEAMLVWAAELGKDDPLILGLIADAWVESTKGVASGPVLPFLWGTR